MFSLNKYITLFAFILIPICTSSQIAFDEYFTQQALRVDYYRSGMINNEQIKLFEFKKESFWSGNKQKTIPTFDYGDYAIEIFDSLTNKLIFKYGYSSLFQEFIYTEKGRIKNNENFEESLKIPFPKKTIKITFLKRDKFNKWEQQLSLFFNPNTNYFIDNSLHKLDSNFIKTIYCSGKPENSFDVVFVADAYTKHDIDKFFNDARRFTSYLLECSPYDKYKDKINIYAVFTASESSNLQFNTFNKHTALQANFNTFDSERYLMTKNYFDLINIASQVPYDNIVVLVNTKHYGGGGIYNFYATCSADNSNSDFLLIHETGHSFAGLADEYYTSEVSVESYHDLNIEPWEENITNLVNFESKWKNMLAKGTPIPTPSSMNEQYPIGVYEGAGYYEKGMYRPAFDCTMKSVTYNNFCEVCKYNIEKIIKHYTSQD